MSSTRRFWVILCAVLPLALVLLVVFSDCSKARVPALWRSFAETVHRGSRQRPPSRAHGAPGGGAPGGGAVQPDHSKRFICRAGRVLPIFQMMGAQKVASSTMFKDLRSTIGLRTDLPCGEDKWFWRCKEPQVFFVFRDVQIYPKLWGDCSTYSDPGVVADFSPDNLWPRWLPKRMESIYGSQKKEIVFAVGFREPKKRMLAAFFNGIRAGWLYQGEKAPTFQEHVDAYFQAKAEQQTVWVEVKKATFRTVLQGLYYQNLRNWLKNGYDASQFIVFPGLVYLSHRDDLRTNPVLQALRARFGETTLLPEVHIDSHSVANKGKHESLEDLLTAETIQRLDAEVFVPQMMMLAQFLAEQLEQGMTLVGYTGKARDRVAVLDWLQKGWDF